MANIKTDGKAMMIQDINNHNSQINKQTFKILIYMSKEKFTPGPWKLKSEFNIIAYNNRAIATTAVYQSNVNSDAIYFENIANSNLIASAPDMYNALTDALKIVKLAIEKIALLEEQDNISIYTTESRILTALSKANPQPISDKK